MIRTSFLLLVALLLNACAISAPPLLLPALISEATVAKVAPASPFAPSADGTRVALVRQGLRVIDLASGREQLLAGERPLLLAWSSDQRLAAAFAQGEGTLVRVFADGRKTAEVSLPGHVSMLAWRGAEELLAVTHTMRTYSFGGHFATLLHRWLASENSATVSLGETTLKPSTVKTFNAVLYQLGQAVLSPWEDEIAYLRLHDPPAFAPYLRLKLHHLETGAEREVAVLPMPATPLSFTADGSVILLSAGAALRGFDPWREEAESPLPFAGPVQGVSTGGRYWLVGDRLLRDGQEFASFPPGSSGVFMAGGRLLLQNGTTLRLLSGLAEEPITIADALHARLLLLRKWRSSGLITPEEFHSRLQRISSP